MPDQDHRQTGTDSRETERPWRPADIFRARKQRAAEAAGVNVELAEEVLGLGSLGRVYEDEIQRLQRALDRTAHQFPFNTTPRQTADYELRLSIARVGDWREK